MEIGIFLANVRDCYPTENSVFLLEQAKAAGAAYVEEDWGRITAESPAFFEALRRLDLGLAVYAFTDEYGTLPDGTFVAGILPRLKEIGVPALMLVCAADYPTGADKAHAEKHIVEAVNKVCLHAAPFGITVLFEDFDSRRIPCGSGADLCRFGQKIPALRYTFDTGNFSFFGEDPLVCYEQLRGRIGHVHVKDRISATDLQVAVTGEGGLPIKEILQKLKADGYQGRLSVEIFGVTPDPANLKKAINYVKESVKE